jgi:signal recognition particle subunit SRP54
VLSKLDGDARGGAALSVASVTGRPIMFARPARASRTSRSSTPTGWPRASSTWVTSSPSSSRPRRRSTSSHADEMERKFLAEEDFTFDDFLEQMAAIKRMGNFKSMLGMMPGCSR